MKQESKQPPFYTDFAGYICGTDISASFTGDINSGGFSAYDHSKWNGSDDIGKKNK